LAGSKTEANLTENQMLVYKLPTVVHA